MQALIFPLVLLVLVGIWCVFETGRKFRREFARRGIAWEAVCRQMDAERGVLVLDTIWGPQRGLGRPVLWWIEVPPEKGADLGEIIRGEPGGERGGGPAGGPVAKLVRCPRAMRSAEALGKKFPPERIIRHSWAVSGELLGTGAQAE